MYKFYCRFIQLCVKIIYTFIRYKNPIVIKGEGVLSSIPSKIKELGLKRPLIVTDAYLFSSGLLDALFASFKKEKVEYSLFKDVIPNPTCEIVLKGYQVYKDEECDSLIAIGGGSPMDTAKAIGAKAVNPKKHPKKFMGLLKVHHKIPTMFAVPTTAGTGSEATIAAVLTDETTSHKAAITDPAIMPKYAVLDPLLTIGLPPHMTSTTGLDALCHATEAYTNHTYCRKNELVLAKRAVKLIYNNLYIAYTDGNNIEARSNMQLAAYYAGLAFTRGSVGYVHAIGHTLGGLYHVPHGLAMSVILPVVLEKYDKKAYRYLSDLAKVIGLKGKNKEELAKGFIQWIKDIEKKMNIPSSFKEIKDNDIDKIVSWAIKEGNPIYPCPDVWNKMIFKEVVISLKGN